MPKTRAKMTVLCDSEESLRAVVGGVVLKYRYDLRLTGRLANGEEGWGVSLLNEEQWNWVGRNKSR